jgi:hypothetical protein
MNIYSAFPTAVATAVPALAGRVFPVNAVEGYATPYCTYSLINTSRIQTLNGYDGEVSFDYQFNFYDVSYDQAKTNATAFWDYIQTVTGTFGSYTLQCVEFMNETETSDLAASKVRFNAILEVRFICVKP